jgi:hypothetical protein
LRGKGFRLSEELQVSMKVELAVMKGTLERFVELAAKDATEHLDGKKEIVAWFEFDPACAIGGQPTGRSPRNVPAGAVRVFESNCAAH